MVNNWGGLFDKNFDLALCYTHLIILNVLPAPAKGLKSIVYTAKRGNSAHPNFIIRLIMFIAKCGVKLKVLSKY